MTSFRDRLRPASFRGVPFLVEETDDERGRRTDIVKLSNREDVFIDDFGGDADTFTVNMYVVGDGYLDDLEALERALLTKGSGQLVHPYRGEKTVVVHGKWKVKQTRKEGGIARLSVTFVDQPPNRPSTLRPDTPAQVVSAATSARTAVQTDFVSRLKTDLPDTYLTSLGTAATALVSALGRVNSAIAQATGVESLLGATITQLGTQAVSIIASPSTFTTTAMDLLVTIPSVGLDVESAAIGQVRSARDLVNLELRRKRTLATLQAVRELEAFGADWLAIAETTSNATIERENRDALRQMVRAGNVIGFCVACLSIPWDSFGQAMEARSLLVDLVDAITIDAPIEMSDDAFAALALLRARAAEHLAVVATTLPRIRPYTPPKELPALVVAQMLYGDATREAEILARNDPPNPALLSSKTSIEVALA